MADKVYMIGVDYLKENSQIDFNVEDKIIINNIIDAQEIDIQKILGSRLYLSLKDKIINSSLSGDYLTLLNDYVTPCLVKYAFYRTIDWNYSKIKNSSVVNQNGEYSNVVDIQVMRERKSSILDDAEYYSNKLKLWLCETDLPEYEDYNPDSLDYYTTPDKKNSYFCGIYTGGGYKKDWKNEK